MRGSSRSGGVRPLVTPPPELAVSTMFPPIDRALGSTATPLYGATPHAKSLSGELQWARRQVSRLERENETLNEANKRLKTVNAELQRAASEARLTSFRKLNERDRQVEVVSTQAAQLRVALGDVQQQLEQARTEASASSEECEQLQHDLACARGVVRSVCTDRQDAFARSLDVACSLARKASQPPPPVASPVAQPPARAASMSAAAEATEAAAARAAATSSVLTTGLAAAAVAASAKGSTPSLGLAPTAVATRDLPATYLERGFLGVARRLSGDEAGGCGDPSMRAAADAVGDASSPSARFGRRARREGCEQ